MLVSNISLCFWAMVLAGSAVAAPAGTDNSRPGAQPNAPVTPRAANSSVTDIAARQDPPRAVLGYRTCSEDQARKFNANGLIADGYNANWPNGGEQIGKGLYITPGPGEWLAPYTPNPWFCVIQGNRDALGRHPKVWIPKGVADRTLSTDDMRVMYDWGYQFGIDMPYAFRLSEIWGGIVGKDVAHAKTMQLVIPQNIAEDREDPLGLGLDLRIQCMPSWQQLPVQETVDYRTAWPRNTTFGKPQYGRSGSGCFGWKCFGGSA